MRKKSLAIFLALVLSVICLFSFSGCDALGDLDLVMNGSSTGTEYYIEDKFLVFGEYPQSVKADSVTIEDTVANDRGYYKGSDGAYYQKLTATPYNKEYKFSNGQKVESGKEYYFKVEPIKWDILDNTGEKLFVASNKVLDKHEFGKSTNSYADSDVAEFLNEDFFLQAFNGYKSDVMMHVTIDNSVASTGYEENGYACRDTREKLFLLSYKEVHTEYLGFHADATRMGTATDYLIAQGVEINTHMVYYGATDYMLRSPVNDSVRDVRKVDVNGQIGKCYIGYQRGVLPAFYLDLTK